MKEPKLRFKEFQDEWQSRKLSEFSEKINERNESESYTSVLTNSAMYGVINQQNFFKKDIANPENIERYTIVKNNDYMYNPRISKYAKFGPVNRNKLNATGIVSPMYLVFRTDDTVSLGFLDNYFLSSYWHKYIYSKGNTGARADRIAIKDSDFMNMKILMPSLKEQKKIGSFFSDLDNQIKLQSDKLETLKNNKKGYLQKMFPSNDSNKPKLRLKDFSDEWKKIKLGKISNIKTGKLDANAMDENGKYDFYTSGVSVYKINEYAFEGESITIAGNGANVGYMHLANGKFNAYQRTYVLNDLKADREFIFYAIQKKIPKIIYNNSRNGNIPYIVLNVLEDLDLLIPTLEEQQMIGMFFENLDQQIELQQNKLTDLKNQKKAYLQKMFI